MSDEDSLDPVRARTTLNVIEKRENIDVTKGEKTATDGRPSDRYAVAAKLPAYRKFDAAGHATLPAAQAATVTTGGSWQY